MLTSAEAKALLTCGDADIQRPPDQLEGRQLCPGDSPNPNTKLCVDT